MDQVINIDQRRKRDNFRIEGFMINRGKTHYILYLKLFDFIKEHHVEDADGNTRPLCLDYLDPVGDDELPFDIYKSDPFEIVRASWNQWNVDVQRSVLDEIWDLLMDTDRSEDSKAHLSDGDKKEIAKRWRNMTLLEQKIHVLDFFLSINPQLNGMDGVMGMDSEEVVGFYNAPMGDLCVLL